MTGLELKELPPREFFLNRSQKQELKNSAPTHSFEYPDPLFFNKNKK